MLAVADVASTRKSVTVSEARILHDRSPNEATALSLSTTELRLTVADGETEAAIERDAETLALALLLGEVDALAEVEGLRLALRNRSGDSVTVGDGDAEALVEEVAVVVADIEAETLEDAVPLAVMLRLPVMDALADALLVDDGISEADQLTELEALGVPVEESDAEGEPLAVGEVEAPPVMLLVTELLTDADTEVLTLPEPLTDVVCELDTDGEPLCDRVALADAE